MKNKPVRTILPYNVKDRMKDEDPQSDPFNIQIRDGMGWRLLKLNDWDTERIFDTLRQLGIDASLERFHDDAEGHGTIESLRKAWSADIDTHDLWHDFPLIASHELWRRLASDILAPEFICDLLYEVSEMVIPEYHKSQDNKKKTDLTKLITNVTTFITYLEQESQLDLQERYEALKAETMMDIPYVMETTLSKIGKSDIDLAIRLYRVMSSVEPEAHISFTEALAYELSRLNRTDEAWTYIDELLVGDQVNPEPYMAAVRFCIMTKRYGRVVNYAVQALGRVNNPFDWDFIMQQLAEYLEDQQELLSEVCRLTVRPGDSIERPHLRTIAKVDYSIFDNVDEDDPEDRYNTLMAAGLNWLNEGIEYWETEDIIRTLNQLGIDISEATFRETARAHRTFASLENEWTKRFDPDDMWLDFPIYAVSELWNRLAPDILCPENVGGCIDSCGILLEMPDNEIDAIAENLSKFADYLEQFSFRELPERYDEIVESANSDIISVIYDCIPALGEQHLQLSQRIYQVLMNTGIQDVVFLTAILAALLSNTGRIDDARAYIAQAIAFAPRHAEPYIAGIHLSDLLSEYGPLTEYAVKALSLTKDYEQWILLYGQLEKVCERHAQPELLIEIRKRVIIPNRPYTGNYLSDDRMPVRVERIGRNDPCPCGSGKKYKKCHGK